MLLKGKKAIVTGAGQSIGKSIALALAKAGADVVVHYRSNEAKIDAERAVKEILQLGRFAFAVQGEFMEDDGPEKFIADAMTELKSADILVSCAAAYEYAPFLELKAEKFSFIQKMNIEVPLRLIQAFSRECIKRKMPGSVIAISSFFSFKPAIGNLPIACSKAGLNMLTKCAALELAPHQIRVNAIAPGRTQTPSNESLMEDKAAWQAIIDKIPLGRTGVPDDYAGLAVLLASDQSSWMTGSIILCDGGFTIG